MLIPAIQKLIFWGHPVHDDDFQESDCSRLDNDDEDHVDHHDDDDADDEDCQESDCSRLAAEQVRGEVGLLIEDRVNRST